jgi:cysteine-rich repeat protein
MRTQRTTIGRRLSTFLFLHLSQRTPSRQRRHSILFTICLVAFSVGRVSAQVFVDDFNDNMTDTSHWSTFHTATGPFVSETNGRVEFLFPAGMVVPGGGQNGFYNAAYQFRCALHGDFDVQLDYLLPEWPADSVSAITLWAGQGPSSPLLGVARQGNMYLGGIPPQTNGISTTDSSGKLRITRTGSLGATYFSQDGGSWTPVVSGFVPVDDFPLFIVASTFDNWFTGTETLIAVDNFQVNQGTLLCPGAPSPVVSDDFNDDMTGPEWHTYIAGTGPTIAEVNQRVEITFPGNSQAGSTGNGFPSAIIGAYVTNGSLSGDFDVRVDYQFLTSPPANTFNVGFLIPNPLIQLYGPPGTVRLARCGDRLAGYYLSDGVWVQAFSNSGITGDLQLYLIALKTDATFSQTALVAFDNFTVNQSQVDCPAVCGDGIVQTGEQCDDGNAVAGDGCCACQLEPLAHADVNGSWQVTENCAGAVLTSSVQLAENTSSGAFTWKTTDCGTLSTQRVATCPTTPSPIHGQVCGTVFQMPPTGSFASKLTFDPAVPSPYGTCNDPPVQEADANERRLDCTIGVDAVSGNTTRISGKSTNDFNLINTNGASCFSIQGSDCSIVMMRNDSPAGTDQTVEPIEGTTVTFSQVSTAGVTNIVPLSQPDGQVPANFQLQGTPVFYDVTTTAKFSGSITVCLPYADANNDGIVDDTDPPINENDLKILHNEGGVFMDRTFGTPDTVNKRICAQVASLSQFVIGAGTAPTDNADAVALQCPCSGPLAGGSWATHKQYVSCVSKIAQALQRGHFLTAAQKKALNNAATQSTCGSVGTTRCCVTSRAALKCKILSAAKCATKSGTDKGIGSCVPDPCGAS